MAFSYDPTTAALAELLDQARMNALGIDPPAALAALSLAQAYDVQDALVVRRSAGGARQSGWKLGITSPVKQRVMGIASPLFGRTFAEGEHSGEARVAHAKLIAPRTEPELAFGLSSPIDDSMDAAALMNAIAWIAPALEITSSRYRSGTRTAVELVADNTSSAAYVIGARIAPGAAPPIDSFATELVCNGVVVARGSTADVLGNPVNALAALAAHLASRGLRTRGGDIVLSGAITDAIPVAAGDVVEARLAGLGIATVTFV
jgi:2-keto-4-pentenoate hydratase